MDQIAAYLSAGSTVVGLSVFIGIVWWACSPKRAAFNDEAARLPFDLPDERMESKKEAS